jgi:hypothetical protein
MTLNPSLNTFINY